MRRATRVLSPRTARAVGVGWALALLVGGVAGVAASVLGAGGVRLAGLSVLITAVSGGWALHGPRGTARPDLVDGATRLPRRPGHAWALAAACVGLAASGLCLVLATLGDPEPPRRIGAVWVAVPVFLGYGGWIVVARLLGRGLTTLTPEGLQHDSLVGRRRRLAWRHVHDVRSHGGPGGALVLETRDGTVVWGVAGQGVAPDALAAAVRCFAKRPQDRALLAGPGALDRWLDPAPDGRAPDGPACS